MDSLEDRINRVMKNGKVIKCPHELKYSCANPLDYQNFFNPRSPVERASMQQNILATVQKKTDSQLQGYLDHGSRNFGDPTYEDPQDVLDLKPSKPPRKRNQPVAVSSPRNKDGRSMLREQKRKLTKKYESLITSLIGRCEENIIMISEKDTIIKNLKEKLKTVLEYNHSFAEENDQLKAQHKNLIKYIEECKTAIRDERERSRDLEKRSKQLADRVRQFELPDRDEEPTTAIPLVEVCMSCSSRQIVLHQTKEHNARLQKDMQAMKDVLYRLNVQLSRYQEKLRTSVQAVATSDKGDHRTGEHADYDSLPTINFGRKVQGCHVHPSPTESPPEDNGARLVDLSGLLSAQALAPLFDAYQESLTEKDNLIQDYEKQFEILNKKSKRIIDENKNFSERMVTLEQEAAEARQGYKKLLLEKETTDIEKATLIERAERAEYKLKEVYELYEDKISTMVRDYETVHREYFQVRTALLNAGNKMTVLEASRAHTVPVDLHEQRLQHCKRLLEELKHQYSMDNERKTEQINKLHDNCKTIQEKYDKLLKQYEEKDEELKMALKNVKQYRKAASVFRQRLKVAREKTARLKRRARFKCSGNVQPLRDAMVALHHIKQEIKAVKSKASVSLEELERRLMSQEHRKDRDRTPGEDKRHHQSTPSSPISSSSDKKQTSRKTKLVPKHGGYYTQRDRQTK